MCVKAHFIIIVPLCNTCPALFLYLNNMKINIKIAVRLDKSEQKLVLM